MGQVKDISNKKFGLLTVLKFSHIKRYPSGNGQAFWKCLCECGNTSTVNGTKLRNGHTRSCGCLVVKSGHSRYRDRVGDVVGKLTVISKAPNSNGRVMWNCKCDCGNTLQVMSCNLKESNTTSCGCANVENLASRVGESNPAWKGGKHVNRKGWTVVHINKKQHLEHRIIASKVLGRSLNSNEVVHHIDEDKSNNTNSNLLICSRSYHTWLHRKIDKLKGTNVYPGRYI